MSDRDTKPDNALSPDALARLRATAEELARIEDAWKAHPCGFGCMGHDAEHVEIARREGHAVAGLHRDIPALVDAAEERDRLRKGLRRYGHHDEDCHYVTGAGPCSCGLLKAIGGPL